MLQLVRWQTRHAQPTARYYVAATAIPESGTEVVVA